jgi:hypothetical protein
MDSSFGPGVSMPEELSWKIIMYVDEQEVGVQAGVELTYSFAEGSAARAAERRVSMYDILDDIENPRGRVNPSSVKGSVRINEGD